jgi:hypothetical protein
VREEEVFYLKTLSVDNSTASSSADGKMKKSGEHRSKDADKKNITEIGEKSVSALLATT